jgi:hypothetical protein
MRSGLLTFLAIVGCTPHPPDNHPTMPPPRAFSAIRHSSAADAVRGYFAGSDQCASRLLRAAFHPAAHMAWIEGDAVRTRAMLAWWQKTDAQASCQPAAERQLALLDREGPFAMAEATSRFAGFAFHDLLLVAETPEGWLIVDKVFERLGDGEVARPGDDAAVRDVLQAKIDAALASDPALLATTHLDDCVYSRVRVGGIAYARESVSEWAARYAAVRERGEDGRKVQWRVVQIHAFDRIAAAKLELRSPTGRHIDHLLLVRTAEGWRIAAATWGGSFADGPAESGAIGSGLSPDRTSPTAGQDLVSKSPAPGVGSVGPKWSASELVPSSVRLGTSG